MQPSGFVSSDREGYTIKTRTFLNALILGSMLIIVYAVVLHGYVKFYLGGKSEINAAGEHINRLCHANAACPTALEGWQIPRTGSATLSRHNMLYFVESGKEDLNRDTVRSDTFRLVYPFFAPDHWYEIQGGVDRAVTSGWKSR